MQLGYEQDDMMAARRAAYLISSPLLGKHADLFYNHGSCNGSAQSPAIVHRARPVNDAGDSSVLYSMQL